MTGWQFWVEWPAAVLAVLWVGWAADTLMSLWLDPPTERKRSK